MAQMTSQLCPPAVPRFTDGCRLGPRRNQRHCVRGAVNLPPVTLRAGACGLTNATLTADRCGAMPFGLFQSQTKGLAQSHYQQGHPTMPDMTTTELEALADQLTRFLGDERFAYADHEDARRLRVLIHEAAAGRYF